MKKLMRSRIFWIVFGVLALDIVLHLIGAKAPHPPPDFAPGFSSQYMPQQHTFMESVSGIIGGLMILGVVYAFFHGISLTFRGHRNFHARMKRDGIWKRDQ